MLTGLLGHFAVVWASPETQIPNHARRCLRFDRAFHPVSTTSSTNFSTASCFFLRSPLRAPSLSCAPRASPVRLGKRWLEEETLSPLFLMRKRGLSGDAAHNTLPLTVTLVLRLSTRSIALGTAKVLFVIPTVCESVSATPT